MPKKFPNQNHNTTIYKQVIKQKFSKTQNAVSESDSTTMQEKQNFWDLLEQKNEPLMPKKLLNQNLHHHHL